MQNIDFQELMLPNLKHQLTEDQLIHIFMIFVRQIKGYS